MDSFIVIFSEFIGNIFFTINKYQLPVFGYRVGFFDIVFAFIIICGIINLFWRGARG